MSISLKKTDNQDPDYLSLIKLLDAELRVMDGDEHAFYSQYNKSDDIKHVILGYENDKAVGSGAFKKYDKSTVEIKRMFVLPEHRGQGIAISVLDGLEKWAKELGFAEAVLETGANQPTAINLYKKCGYEIIPNYGQYIGKEASSCMKKALLNKLKI